MSYATFQLAFCMDKHMVGSIVFNKHTFLDEYYVKYDRKCPDG